MFQPNDRVEHVNYDAKGTILTDNGHFVTLLWDDGQTGVLEYKRNVLFSAHRIVKLVPKGKTHLHI